MDTVVYPLQLTSFDRKVLKILASQQGITIKELLLRTVNKTYEDEIKEIISTISTPSS